MLAYLPAGVAVTAIALTYLFCLRPMRRTGCDHRLPAAGGSAAQARELELARTELELLRLREQQRDRGAAA